MLVRATGTEPAERLVGQADAPECELRQRADVEGVGRRTAAIAPIRVFRLYGEFQDMVLPEYVRV